MTGHGAVRRLVFVIALGGDEHAGHHRQRTEGRGDHVAHHVAVVVLARPDEAALGADDARNRIVDERVEVFDARRLELFFIFGGEKIGKDVLEVVVVDLGDGVLGGEPQILTGVQRVFKAAARKGLDGFVQIVLPLNDARALEIVNQRARLGAVGGGVDQLRLAGAGDLHLRVLVYVAVGVARDGDGRLPGANGRLNAADQDRRAEHRAVEHGADGAVGGLPHLLEGIFLHALRVGRDGGALDGYAVFGGGVGGVHRHLIVRLVAVDQTQIVIFGLEIDIRLDEQLFDPLPEHARHFVAVHFDQRRFHGDLLHEIFPLFSAARSCIFRKGRDAALRVI